MRTTDIPSLLQHQKAKKNGAPTGTYYTSRWSTILFILILILSSTGVHAQNDTTRYRTFGFAYFAQGASHPGFTVTLEQQLLTNDRYQFLVAAKAGMYYHYRNNTGVFVMAQSGQRFRIHGRLYFEQFLGIGYLQSFLNGGDAYYVNASGQIQKASKIGNPHFMPSISFGLNYHIKNRTSVFARTMIYWVIPFNQSSLVQYALEAGASIRLKK